MIGNKWLRGFHAHITAIHNLHIFSHMGLIHLNAIAKSKYKFALIDCY